MNNMKFLWYMPTTAYQNLLLSYSSELSSAGKPSQNYSYSLDSGLTFMTANLPVTSYTPGIAWGLQSLDLSTISGANNNPKFVFCISYSGSAAQAPSGNDRYDNITVEGDTSIVSGIAEINANNGGYTLFPNPSKDNLFVSGSFEGTKTISIYNAMGQMVYTTEQTKKQVPISTSQLENGMYFITIKEINGKIPVTLKFIKSN